MALVDGKPVPRATSDAGVFRVRPAAPDAVIPNQKKEDGAILFGLDVANAGMLQWQKAVGLRINRALDEDGHLLPQLSTSFKPAVSTATVRGNVVINGMPIVPPEDESSGPGDRLVPVRLKREGTSRRRN